VRGRPLSGCVGGDGRRMGRLLALIVLAALALPARGTIYIRKSLAEMVGEADRVVQGRVLSKDSAWEGGVIWTTYVIQVLEHLKGEAPGRPAPAQVTVRQPGGSVGEIGQVAVGIPHFAVGEELIVFTRDFGAGWQTVLNGPQGHLTIQTSVSRLATGEEKLVKSIARLRALYDGVESEDLDAFKARVRALAAPAPEGGDR